jgi:hypothetical protein
MTKHTGSSTDEAISVVAASASVGLHFSSLPLPKDTTHNSNKLASVHVDGAADEGGSWLESMKSSSPRNAANVEHDNWMVLPLCAQLPPINTHTSSPPFFVARSIDS